MPSAPSSLSPSMTSSGILASRSICSGSTLSTRNVRSFSRKASPFSTAAGSSLGWGWMRSSLRLPRNSSLPKLGSFQSRSRASSATCRASFSLTLVAISVFSCVCLGPVGLAQQSLEDLARILAGQLVRELHHAWDLVARQLPADVVAHRLGGEPDGGVGVDVGADRLAHVLVGDAEDGAVAHALQAEEAGLDLGRVDVDAPGDDHVVATVVEVEVAVGVQVPDVT